MMNTLMLAAANQIIKRQAGPDLLGRAFLNGNLDYGYYGLFRYTEVIDTAALMQEVGLSVGEMNVAAPDWLGFALDGKKLLIPKKSLISKVTWEELNAAGVIDGKIISHGGNKYKVRQIEGGDSDTDPTSEWNLLIYKVSGDIAQAEYWAKYTAADLGIGGSQAGRYVMTNPYTAWQTTLRGGGSVKGYNGTSRTLRDVSFGWRPVLELIE